MAEHPRLAILATTHGHVTPDGRVGLSRKFLEGVLEYQRHWPGGVSVLMEPGPNPQSDLDYTAVRPLDLPFELSVSPFDMAGLACVQRDRPTVVLAPLATRFLPLQRTRRASSTRWVAFVEWSLATRKRITALMTPNVVSRAKRLLGAAWRERGLRQVARLAAGLQCNGTPAYEAYRHCNPNRLLYFDGRVRGNMLASRAAIDARLERNAGGGRLKLVFSGRLTTIKGADHLVDVAAELRRLGVEFELAICGDGDLGPAMRRRVTLLGLDERLCFKGVLDFERELVPFVRDWADVFVCCHRQGDPSCTYVETLSCGVPIAGYANEALEGMQRGSKAGWLTPMDRPDLLARQLADLAAHREAIRAASMNALAFATQHTFEATFAARAQHLLVTGLA